MSLHFACRGLVVHRGRNLLQGFFRGSRQIFRVFSRAVRPVRSHSSMKRRAGFDTKTLRCLCSMFLPPAVSRFGLTPMSEDLFDTKLTVRIGCRLVYQAVNPTPILLVIRPRSHNTQLILSENLSVVPLTPTTKLKIGTGMSWRGGNFSPGRRPS